MVLIAAALVTATILMVPAVMAEPEKPEGLPDFLTEPVGQGAFEWLGDEPKTTNVSGAGLIILVILVFGGAIGAIVLINKFQEHQKKIEELEQQLKEKKEKE